MVLEAVWQASLDQRGGLAEEEEKEAVLRHLGVSAPLHRASKCPLGRARLGRRSSGRSSMAGEN